MHFIVGVAVFGILYSIFLGIFANRIFSFEGRKPNYDTKSKPGWSWRVFQFWFNFVCSLIGWAITMHYLCRLRGDPSHFAFKTDAAVPLLIAASRHHQASAPDPVLRTSNTRLV